MPGDHIRLLALDGGGVRGLSSLMILGRLMAAVDSASPPKPCDYFDMIGGTSTGGLIAVMLGRLRMTVDECITAYTSLSDRVFEKKSHRVNIKGKLQGRFDAGELERAIKQILRDRCFGEDALLKDADAPCKVFVCATSKQTSDTVCLASYRSPRSDSSDLLESTTIWQACRATSAATTFFDPIAIGPFGEEFIDGALGANNPVYSVWNQAQDVWGDKLQRKLRCLVSIGTGVPNLQPVHDDVLGIWGTLKAIATETEKTAQQFHRDKSSLDDEERYFRFNVEHGLEDVGLEESKKKNEIAAATRRYVESQAVFKQMKACADSLTTRQLLDETGKELVDGLPFALAWRVRGIPTGFDNEKLANILLHHPDLQQRSSDVPDDGINRDGAGSVLVHTLAPNVRRDYQVATVRFRQLPHRLRKVARDDQLTIDIHQFPETSSVGVKRKRTFLPPLRLAIDRHFHGITVLFSPPGRNHSVDMLAVPGLGGHPFGSFVHKDDGHMWLIDNLPQDMPAARVMIYGYGSELQDSTSFAELDDLAGLLRHDICELLRSGDQKPLALIGHSLGGLLIKEALIRTMESDSESDLVSRIFGGLFFGVPNDGMDIGSLVPMVNNQPNRLLLESLRAMNSQVLRLQRRNFAGFLDRTAFEMFCFYETRLSPTATQDSAGQWKMNGTPRCLVSYASATSCLPPGVISDRSAHIPRIHSELVKFAAYDPVYDRVSRVLQHMCQNCIKASSATRASRPKQREIVPLETVHTYTQQLQPPAELTKSKANYPQKMTIEASLAVMKAMLGEEHPSTLTSMATLALTYRNQGRWEDAEKLETQVMEIRKTKFGADHRDTLTSMANLASTFRIQGRWEASEKLEVQVMERRKRVLGADHHETLTSMGDLASIYRNQGRWEDAEKLETQVMEIRKTKLGSDHRDTLTSMVNLALTYRNQGKLELAENLEVQVMETRKSVLGEGAS